MRLIIDAVTLSPSHLCRRVHDIREANMSVAEKAARQKRIDVTVQLQAAMRGRNVRRAAAAVRMQRIIRGRVQLKKFLFRKQFAKASGSASRLQLAWRKQVSARRGVAWRGRRRCGVVG